MSVVRVMFRVVCALILIAAIVQITARAHAESALPSHTGGDTDAARHEEKVAGPDRAAVAAMLAEIDGKKQALEARSRDLEEQEARIKEREKELDKKLKEMERLRAAVSGELEAQKKNGEERVAKMVAVFETMTPKSAANVMETLDDWLSVEVLKRMDVKRVAKVMNLMDKNRSAKLSELLTGYYNPEAKREISSIRAGQGTPQAPAPKSVEAAVAAAMPAVKEAETTPRKGETKPNEQSTRSR